ncbi:MAG: DUF3137 domain-containing protein [Sulfurimonas sp.]|jgi:hypothetical protein
MKSVSELTDFYYKSLYPTLEKLEIQRKNLRYRIAIIGAFYTLVLILLFITFTRHVEMSIDFLVIFIFVYLGIGGFIYKFLTKDYTSEFKNKIIEPLIHAIDEKLTYSSDSHMPQHLFERSELFTSKPDKISGNDLVQGEINGIKIEFSDLHVQTKHKNSKGKDEWQTLFRGLFIVSEFNKNFNGKTIVLPDTAQSTFGNLLGGWLQSKNFVRDELVKMDDTEFEKEFVVYSNDQIEARYILSHSLMQRLLSFKKKSKHPVYISFIGDSIHMAIYYNKDLFEPAIFHSLLDYKIAMEYITTLQLAISIVEELKLSQKLWSKK